jgi:hypothetical protein
MLPEASSTKATLRSLAAWAAPAESAAQNREINEISPMRIIGGSKWLRFALKPPRGGFAKHGPRRQDSLRDDVPVRRRFLHKLLYSRLSVMRPASQTAKKIARFLSRQTGHLSYAGSL